MAVRIGTNEHDGTFFRQGLALKAVLGRVPALAPVEVRVTAEASIENAKRLDADALDFGFMASNWIGRARKGEPPFSRPIALRMAAPMNAGPLFFIVRAESGIAVVGDLRGRRVAVGAQMSGMTQHAASIFGALGMRLDIVPHYLDFAAGAEALARGEVDAQLQCPVPNPLMTELSARIPLRVLPYEEGQIDQLLAAVPHYRSTVLRKEQITGLTADTTQIAVVNVLVTHERTPDALVRAVVRAIVAGADELGRIEPLFDRMGDLFAPLQTHGASALEFGGVPLHPGASAAYRDAGLLAI